MPRIRTVKPEYWTDEKILSVSITARLFFIGLWNWADDHGVVENKPMQLKARIFPCDQVDVPALVDELVNVGLLQKYQPNGEGFLLIRNFTKHQVVDRPRKSSLPLPENNDNQLKSIEISSGREGKGKERKGSILYGFDAFWTAYPKKVGKGNAEKVWMKLKPDQDLMDRILQALAWQRKQDQWVKDDGQFIPHPATWLNQKRWEDQPTFRGGEVSDQDKKMQQRTRLMARIKSLEGISSLNEEQSFLLSQLRRDVSELDGRMKNEGV